MIGHNPDAPNRVSLKGLDYVREVLGATAALDAKGEWLALLVRLRSTGHRELLLIYDPTGTLAHQELLVRTAGGPEDVLWSAGQAGDPPEFVLNLGEPLRYAAKR